MANDVANIGTKNKNEEAWETPPFCNAINHNENEPMDAGMINQIKLNQPKPLNCAQSYDSDEDNEITDNMKPPINICQPAKLNGVLSILQKLRTEIVHNAQLNAPNSANIIPK